MPGKLPSSSWFATLTVPGFNRNDGGAGRRYPESTIVDVEKFSGIGKTSLYAVFIG
jgi:hypothetical protein